jgi:hypothetical protein
MAAETLPEFTVGSFADERPRDRSPSPTRSGGNQMYLFGEDDGPLTVTRMSSRRKGGLQIRCLAAVTIFAVLTVVGLSAGLVSVLQGWLFLI